MSESGASLQLMEYWKALGSPFSSAATTSANDADESPPPQELVVDTSQSANQDTITSPLGSDDEQEGDQRLSLNSPKAESDDDVSANAEQPTMSEDSSHGNDDDDVSRSSSCSSASSRTSCSHSSDSRTHEDDDFDTVDDRHVATDGEPFSSYSHTTDGPTLSPTSLEQSNLSRNSTITSTGMISPASGQEVRVSIQQNLLPNQSSSYSSSDSETNTNTNTNTYTYTESGTYDRTFSGTVSSGEEDAAQEESSDDDTASTDATQPTSPRKTMLQGDVGSFFNLEEETGEGAGTEVLLVEGGEEGNEFELIPMQPLGGESPFSGAKVTVLGSNNFDGAEDDEDSHFKTSLVENDSLREIERTLNRTRDEFEKGTDANRRYNPRNEDDESESLVRANSSALGSTTPSFLNKDDIFHKSASDAIAALLAPRDGVVVIKTHSSHSKEMHPSLSGQMSMGSAFQASGGPTVISQDASFHSHGRKEVSESLLKPETEKKLEEMASSMHDPTATTMELLTAIAMPEDKSHTNDLAAMVRRKNACGAIKILTNDTQKRGKLCWTLGVLPALTTVLAEAAEVGLETAFPDARVRHEYDAARNRAIAALLNMCIPKENRIAVFHTPGLVQAMLAIILEDRGLARRGCTAIVAHLAQSVENRLLLAQVPGFMDAMVSVLRPKPHGAHVKPVDGGEQNSGPLSLSGRPPLPKKAGEGNDGGAPATGSVLSDYDESADEFLRASRQNVFAILGHLGKEKDNAYHFARDAPLLATMIAISNDHTTPCHALAVKVIANMTRHRLNTKLLVFQERTVVPALVKAANSNNSDCRLYACYALQNMAQDKGCRQELAVIEGLVAVLCSRGRYATSQDERLAAISALKNLCDEPANLIPLTNAPGCVATLMHIAHGREKGVSGTMQYRACDALATLSHWLRKIASTGKSIDSEPGASSELFVPSLRVVTWNQYE